MTYRNLCQAIKKSFSFTLLLLLFAQADNADADVVINITESNGDVIAQMSGSFDLNATLGLLGSSGGFNGFSAETGAIGINFGAGSAYAAQGPLTPFGNTGFDQWDSATGDIAAFASNSAIVLPFFYESGDPLTGTAIEFNDTFQSLGFIPGTYVSTFNNGVFSETLTVNIVPEPSSGLLLCGGLLFLPRRLRRSSL